MNNSTYQWKVLPHDECITWLAVMMVESVAIVTLNVFTVTILIKTRSLRRRAMYLVINLAVADVFVGGCSEVIEFYYMGWQCNLWKYIVVGKTRWQDVHVFTVAQRLFVVASVTNIVAISLERMYATFFPLRHRVTKKRIYVVTVGMVWAFAAAVSISAVNVYFNSLKLYLLFSLACFCLLTICVCYASIAVKIYCGAHPQHHGAASRERKLTVTLFIMTFVSLLTYLPFVLWELIDYTIGNDNFLFELKQFRLRFFLVVLYHANSLVNPILYAIRMPEFKRALISLSFCRPQQRQVILPLRVM